MIDRLELGLHILDEVSSWSEEDQPVTVREFMASRAPQETIESFNIDRIPTTVRTIQELTFDEIKKVVIASLGELSDDFGITGGGKEFLKRDLIHEAETSQSLSGVLDIYVTDIRLCQDLIMEGRVFPAIGEHNSEPPQPPF